MLGVAATVGALAALTGTIGVVARARGLPPLALPTAPPNERVAWVEPRPPLAPVAMPVRELAQSFDARRDAPPVDARREAIAADTSRRRSGSEADAAPPRGDAPTLPGTAVSGPRASLAPSGARVGAAAPLDAAGRDSARLALAWTVTALARTTLKGDRVMDAEWRDLLAGRRASLAPTGFLFPPSRRYGTGAAGISAPLFSGARSARQQRSDSLVHAANLERLRRIADRARARRDSLRADSLHADSLRRLAQP